MMYLAECSLRKNDFKMAREWWNRACGVGNLIAQNDKEKFLARVLKLEEAMQKVPERFSETLETLQSCFMRVETKLSEYVNSPATKYNYQELQSYALAGSATAQQLCKAVSYRLTKYHESFYASKKFRLSTCRG